MNKKILILGKGFIGECLQKALDCPITDAWIKSYADAARIIRKFHPGVIINCVGLTGRRSVDDCERDVDGVLLANSFIPVILAEACLRNGIKLVHISSGCIFNFDYASGKPVGEESEDYFFKLFYSRSKIYADRPLEALAKKYDILIARIRIPLLNAKHPKNILDKLLKYKKVIDIPNSVTYIPDFVKAIRHLIRINARGVYNVANKGGLRYPRLMEVYKKQVAGFRYRVVDFRKLGLVRTNLVLSVAKLEKSGFKVREINSVLGECVKEYLKS